MLADKTYYFHDQPKTYQEAKDFIDWYRRSIHRSFDRHMVISRHVPRGSYALDYGCGWGTFSEILHAERGCRVDGIDLDPHSIEIAKDMVGEEDGLSFSVKHIGEIADEIYEVVLSTQVIEHTFNPGFYLKECNRVLQTGGLLIISLPNIIAPRYIYGLLAMSDARVSFSKISRTMKNHDRTHDHLQAWDPITFCRLICALGFEFVDYEPMEGLPLPRGHYWRHPWWRFKNLSYTMMFKVRKYKYVDIQPTD